MTALAILRPPAGRPPTGCPHCLAARVGPHHFRDAGQLSPAEALELGYCPELARARGGLRR